MMKIMIKKSIMDYHINVMSKSLADKKFSYFKEKVLEHLNDLEKEEKKEVKKALLSYEKMEKAGYPVGTIRTWKGKKYVKIAPNKWRPKYDSESRGAKLSIASLKKKAEQCATSEELLQLVLEHKSRFSDDMGRPLPFVKELSDYVSKLNDSIESKNMTSKKNDKQTDTNENKKNTTLNFAKVDKDPILEEATSGEYVFKVGRAFGKIYGLVKKTVGKLGQKAIASKEFDSIEDAKEWLNKKAKKYEGKRKEPNKEPATDKDSSKETKQGVAQKLREEFTQNTNKWVGTSFKNKSTGIEAVFSKTSQKEMRSRTDLSKENGFTIQEHFEVANQVKELFENASLEKVHDDVKNNDPKLKIERYLSQKVELKNGKEVQAIITVKHSTDKDGRHLYSIEAVDIKNALTHLRAKGEPPKEGTISTNNIADNNKNVNEGGDKKKLSSKERKTQALIDYIKHQVNVDITPYINNDYDTKTRRYVNVYTKYMPINDLREIKMLAAKYNGFSMEDNGGYGTAFVFGDRFTKTPLKKSYTQELQKLLQAMKGA